MHRPTPAGPSRPRRWLIVVLPLVLWGFGTHGTFAGTGDEPHYLAIAHSLAFDGDVDVRNNYGDVEPLLAGGRLEPELHARAGTGGALRPVHDIGLPILLAPVVRVAAPLVSFLSERLPERLMQRAKLTPTTLYRHITSLAMIALATVLGALMFDVFIALGATGRSAAGMALLLIASPPLLAYSTLMFTEFLSAFLALFAFDRLVVRPSPGIRASVLTGIATGFLLLVHVRNIGLVLGLTLVAVLALRRYGTRSHALAFAVSLSAMLACRAAVTHHFWGTWLTTPHAAPGSWTGWSDAVQLSGMRLVALLFDQEYGLLIYAPLYAAVVAGLPVLARRAPAVARALLIVTACYLFLVLLPLTNVHGWSGQWCPAGRFLTPILPVIGLGLYFALQRFRAATLALIAVQIVLSAYFWQNPKLLWNDGDGRAAFCARIGGGACGTLPSFAKTVR